MTAMNLVVQPRAGAAYLLTDTGVYDSAGRIRQFRTKIVTAVIGGGRAYAALSGCGGLTAHHLHDLVRGVRAGDAKTFLSGVERGFNALDQQLCDAGRYSACGDSAIALVAGVFEIDSAQGLLCSAVGASGYRIGNGAADFEGPFQPGRLEPIAVHLTRTRGAPFEFVGSEAFGVDGADLSDPSVWNPETGAAQLAEAQRRDPFMSDEGPYYAVGGRAVLTRVSAEGFAHRVVRSWPDRGGRKISPRDPAKYGLFDRLRCRMNALCHPIAFPTIHVQPS